MLPDAVRLTEVPAEAAGFRVVKLSNETVPEVVLSRKILPTPADVAGAVARKIRLPDAPEEITSALPVPLAPILPVVAAKTMNLPFDVETLPPADCTRFVWPVKNTSP